MKVSLSWLKDFVDLKGTPNQIAHTLTQAGIEVEGVEQAGSGFTKVVIAKVLEALPHPNADKLQIATVTDGVDTFQVVCGAANCKSGMKTALALEGAELTDASGQKFIIKKTKLRGIESCGMLCSAKELGLSSDHEGIMEFGDHMKEGTSLTDLYSDVVFDLSLTPNLGHASSVVGVARELAASYKIKLHWPVENPLIDNAPDLFEKISIEVEAKKESPRYSACVIEGVKIGPSPDWLKQRLEKCGLRPINNIVDATNFVLHEIGQPLHAFDLDKINGKKIIVRKSKAGEKIETLDGKGRELEEGLLVIADLKGPIAIAGIMGGANSEVDDSTVNILIESAYFDPSTIRRGSKRLQLQSEASRRFEKGGDPSLPLYALERAAWLIQQIAGGEIRTGRFDIQSQVFPPKVIACRLSRINKILGLHLSVDEVETIFKNLCFEVQFDGQDTFQVTVPTFRGDITAEIDLVEEAARLWGYDNIAREPAKFQATQMPHASAYLFEKEVKRKLIAEGLQEFVNCDLIGPTVMKIAYGTEELPAGSVEVLNPVSIEQSLLRLSLLPGLLQVVKHNLDNGNPNIAGFEVGRIHFKENEKYLDQTVLSIVLTGLSSPQSYDPKSKTFDFRDLKGIIENLLSGLGIDKYEVKRSTLATLHPGKQAAIFVNDIEVGTMGEIHPSVQRRLDTSQTIYFAELNLVDIFQLRKKDIKMNSLSIFPGSKRDWTVTMDEKVPVQLVIDAVMSASSDILKKITLSDIYRSATLGADKKNATFHFEYLDIQKTLEQEVVDREHTRLVETAQQHLSSL